MEYLKKIDGGTTLKEFPEKYNADNKALVDEINRLNDIIKSRDNEIATLKLAINSAFNKIRGEFKKELEKLDDKYVKKEN